MRSGPLREVASGAKWTAISAWGERLVSTAVIVVLGRLLSVEDFGLVAVATALIYFLTIFQDAGLPSALVQRDELRSAHVSSALTVNAGISLVSTIALVPLASPIASLLGQPDAAVIIRALSANLVLGGLAAVPQAMLQRRLEFRALAVRKLVAKGAGATVAVTIAFSGGGAWALVGQSLTQRVVGLVVLWSAIPDRPSLGFEKEAFRDLFAFGSFQLGNGLLTTTMTRADNFVVSRVLGATALGYYAIAYRFLDILHQLFTKVLGSVMMPVLSRLQSDRQGHRAAVLDLLGITWAVAGPAFLGWALVADPALTLVFGDRWSGAVGASQALAFVGLHRVFVTNTHLAMASLGHSAAVFYMKILITGVSLGVFVMTARYGITTMSAAYAAVLWATTPVDLLVLRHITGIGLRSFLRRLLGPATAMGAMAASVLGVRLLDPFPGSDLATTLLRMVVGGVTYLGALALLDPGLAERITAVVRRRGRTTPPVDATDEATVPPGTPPVDEVVR